eukprot:6997370-Prymnesium_polylepis.1
MADVEDVGDDDQADEYAWEATFDRVWEAVKVGPDGELRGGTAQERRAAQRHVRVGVKRGMLRTIFLIIDCSRNARDQDGEMRPSRLAVMQEVASSFIRRYFEQNPISSLALIISRDGRAESRTEPSCNARQHLAELQRLTQTDCRGDASLQNSLDLAREALENVPSKP